MSCAPRSRERGRVAFLMPAGVATLAEALPRLALVAQAGALSQGGRSAIAVGWLGLVHSATCRSAALSALANESAEILDSFVS